MTGKDKTILYNLLKTSSDAYYGYSSPEFERVAPMFSDDEVQQEAEKAADSMCSIKDIASKIAVCSRCKLCKTRTNTVPGEGVLHPVVFVVGEGPGAEEDKTGRPFVGPAGKLLDKMLAAISLDRFKNCFIANVVKCRPPRNRDPEPSEAQACRQFLDAQMSAGKPAMILAVGRIAAQNLLNTKDGIGALRGKFYDFGGIPLLVTYHPSALLRNADLKRPAWNDLKMFRKRLQSLVPGYENMGS